MSTGKKLWKIVVAALLLVPLFAGALGANAAEAGTADVTLHKRVFKDNLPEGLPKVNTGQLDPDFGGEALPGAEFTVYDVTTKYHAAIVGSTQQVAMDSVIADYNATPGAFTALRPAVETSDPAGLAFFANLPLQSGGKDAAYLFVETKTPTNPTITQKAAPFILAMPIFTSLGEDGELNTDIHVYPKNVKADNEKEMTNAGIFDKITIGGVEHPNVQIGDTLSYKLTVQVPADINKATTFVIKDTPDAGMVVADPANIVVTGAGLAAGDYTPTVAPDRKSLEISVDPQKATPGGTITITYDMVLTSDAPVDTSIENHASIEIDGQTTTTITPPPGVITNGKQFIKKDAHTGNPLEGAVFKVYREIPGEDGPDKEWAQFNLVGDTYVFADWGTEAAATPVESADDGMIRLKGMIEGGYYMEEISTPDGYVLLSEPYEFQITNGESLAGEDLEYLLPIDNVPKGLLPSTGGSGIYAFLIIGAMMMGGAYIWFKRSKEQAEV